MIKNKHKKSREEINEQSKLLKRKRKHKGLPSGSRFKQAESTASKTKQETLDPRIGSKKPISLDPKSAPIAKVKPATPTPVNKKVLSPELELEQLENDPYLEQLLDLVDEGEVLTTKQQQDLDRILDRIDELMNQLGYTDSDLDDDEDYTITPKDDIVSLLKKQ